MNAMKIFLAFIAIMVLGFFAVGFTDTVQAPTNATALAQYNNLTQATGLASDGLSAVMLILIMSMVLAALFFMIKLVKR